MPSPYGKAAAGEHGRALERADELAREAALADARLAVDREQVRAAVADGALVGVLEQVELGLAADERRLRRVRATASASVRRRPRARPRPARQRPCSVDRPDVLDLDAAEREPVRARGRAGARPARPPAASRAARLTASPVANVESPSSATTSPDSMPIRASSSSSSTASRIAERGANRALGVVLVRLRDPEGGHDRVAGELLDDPAVRDHAVRDAVEERLDTAAHDLRIGARDERRRVRRDRRTAPSQACVPRTPSVERPQALRFPRQ